MPNINISPNRISRLICFSLLLALAIALMSSLAPPTYSVNSPIPIAASMPQGGSPRCDPGYGGRVFAGGGDVEVQILRPHADLTSDIYLFRPGQAARPIGSSRDFNKPPVLLGQFPAGSELVFGIVVRGTGDTFRTGAATRNPDGIVHARVDCLADGGAVINFEDVRGGGDQDFDDVRIQVRNRNVRGITEQMNFPPCAENARATTLTPTWGRFGQRRELVSNAGEKLELRCSPVNNINSYQLIYTQPGIAGFVAGSIRIGLCPFRCGSNSASFTYTSDANGDNKPDRFIMTYWKSRDYGANDNPNPWTGQSENTPVLDHAISFYQMATDNYAKWDDKYAYATPPPASENGCPAARESTFLGRQVVPRKPNEMFFRRFNFAHYRRQDTSVADREDPYSLADLNRDGSLDENDSQIFESTYGVCIGDSDFFPGADFDGDGCVTSIDKEVWLDLFAGSTGNHAPRAIVKNIEVVANSSCKASISPNDVNDGSFDPDGDDITLALDSTGPFDIGDHLVTLTVTDSHGASSSFSTIVTVVPMNITNVSTDKAQLWPPNHKMVDVTINYDVIYNCGSSPGGCVLTVTSNEPVDGIGDADTAPDWQIVDDHHLRLRAERAGNSDGRTYTITITCTDTNGNSSAKSVIVTAPKSQR